jgi:hypothetical protein
LSFDERPPAGRSFFCSQKEPIAAKRVTQIDELRVTSIAGRRALARCFFGGIYFGVLWFLLRPQPPAPGVSSRMTAPAGA